MSKQYQPDGGMHYQGRKGVPSPNTQPKQDELEKRVRYLLDTRHTIPSGQSHTDTYAPGMVKLIKSEVLSVLEEVKKELPDTSFYGTSIKVKQNIRDGDYHDGVLDSRRTIEEIEKRYK